MSRLRKHCEFVSHTTFEAVKVLAEGGEHIFLNRSKVSAFENSLHVQANVNGNLLEVLERLLLV